MKANINTQEALNKNESLQFNELIMESRKIRQIIHNLSMNRTAKTEDRLIKIVESEIQRPFTNTIDQNEDRPLDGWN